LFYWVFARLGFAQLGEVLSFASPENSNQKAVPAHTVKRHRGPCAHGIPFILNIKRRPLLTSRSYASCVHGISESLHVGLRVLRTALRAPRSGVIVRAGSLFIKQEGLPCLKQALLEHPVLITRKITPPLGRSEGEIWCRPRVSTSDMCF